MYPQILRTTIFPYTTLFRSIRVENADINRILDNTLTLYDGRITGIEVRKEFDRSIPPLRLDPEQIKDRKRTRLNSSHVRISYAVFCLKKKIIFYYLLIHLSL